jgi:hypothetical protein
VEFAAWINKLEAVTSVQRSNKCERDTSLRKGTCLQARTRAPPAARGVEISHGERVFVLAFCYYLN